MSFISASFWVIQLNFHMMVRCLPYLFFLLFVLLGSICSAAFCRNWTKLNDETFGFCVHRKSVLNLERLATYTCQRISNSVKHKHIYFPVKLMFRKLLDFQQISGIQNHHLLYFPKSPCPRLAATAKLATVFVFCFSSMLI